MTGFEPATTRPPDNYDYSIDNADYLLVSYLLLSFGLLVGLITAYNRDWFNNNYYCNKDNKKIVLHREFDGQIYRLTKSYLSICKQVIYPDFAYVKIYGVTKIEQGL